MFHRQKRKKSTASQAANSPASTSTLLTRMVCTDEQCFRVPHTTPPRITIPIPIHSSDTFIEPERFNQRDVNSCGVNWVNDHFSLSPEFIDMVTRAAKKGCLTGFLLTLSNEMSNEILQALRMPEQTRYWSSQVVRSLVVYALGTELSLAFAIPAMTFLLTEYPMKFNKNNINLLTLSALLTVSFFKNPAAAFLVAIGMAVTSSVVTKMAFEKTKYTFGLYKQKTTPIISEEPNPSSHMMKKPS